MAVKANSPQRHARLYKEKIITTLRYTEGPDKRMEISEKKKLNGKRKNAGG